MTPSTNSTKTPAGRIDLVSADADDEDFLTEVYVSTRFSEFAVLGWNEAQVRQFLEKQNDFQKQSYQMQFSALEIFIISLDSKKIGRLIVNRTETEIRLVDISLLPEFRSAGIGTKIITDLMDEADKRGLPLALRVAVANSAAFRLYQKLGFQITDRDDLSLAMEWRLDFGL